MDYAERAREWFHGVYEGDLAVIDRLAGEEVAISYPVFQTLFNVPTLRGKEKAKAFAERFGRKWAEPVVTIHETIAQGRQVVLVWSFRARDTAASGAEAGAAGVVRSWGGMSLIRFDDEGKVAAEIGEESEPGPMGRMGSGLEGGG